MRLVDIEHMRGHCPDVAPVDAVQVVRCKDCKYLGFRGMEAVCEHVNIYGIIKPWDYCSRGERKEVNETD